MDSGKRVSVTFKPSGLAKVLESNIREEMTKKKEKVGAAAGAGTGTGDSGGPDGHPGQKEDSATQGPAAS